MYRRLTLSSISSAQLLAITRFFAKWSGTCLLYSGGSLDSAQRSFLGFFPFESVEVHHQRIDYRLGNFQESSNVQNPWEGLQTQFFDSLAENPDAIAFGWLGYGMGAYADEEKILPYRPASLPDAYWQRCAIQLEVDSRSGETCVQIDTSAMPHLDIEQQDWVERLSTLNGWQEFIETLPKQLFSYEKNASTHLSLYEAQRQALYLEQVKQAQELIRAGEIYQVNLSQNFTFQSSRCPFSLFQQVCELNPAPFSAYFRLHEVCLISTSPERFLSKKGDRLETRPIKGTIQRGQTQAEDDVLRKRLMDSVKEKAELLMITDLMRNDLGKISKTGSVKTEQIWRCEAYTNVFHLISIIRSQVNLGLRPLEIIRSCFPGGSITGCPKLRAMEVIDSFEERARGIYTGSIGYINGSGDFDLNIAIRTLVAEGRLFSLQLGAGIVIDSNPLQEYLETLLKGDSIFQILQSREIVEQQ